MKIFAALACLLVSLVCIVRADYADKAASAIEVLTEKYYSNSTGLWAMYWWQSANFMETIARLGQIDASFKPNAIEIIFNTYHESGDVGDVSFKRKGKKVSKAKQAYSKAKDWMSFFYDDMGFWAMAWIAAYDLTGDVHYLKAATTIYENMLFGVASKPCKGGGIWWNKKQHDVVTIANELVFTVAAQLANREKSDMKYTYLAEAKGYWNWFSTKSTLINSDNLINDRLIDCKNIGKIVTTYDQGVILAGLSELSRAENGTDPSRLEYANRIAHAVLSKLTIDGILTEPVEGQLDHDIAMFKGAFVRGLSTLNQLQKKQEYTDFLKRNADSVWNRKRVKGLMPDRWQGSKFSNAASQGAGIDVLVAAAQAERDD
ncbi:hypothetical protein NX059_008596 [Plenodomus lindquistii]|nr:hypothetical protein NX059_008596 [Plenodomus lindquistii]